MDAVVTTPAVGTTLAVLQAYPLGTLEVEHTDYHTGRVSRHLVVGINQEHRAGGGWVVETESVFKKTGEPTADIKSLLEATKGKSFQSITECLPVLRPFSALCEELPDGTVPAVEVAKMMFRSEKCCNWDEATARYDAENFPSVKVIIPDTRKAYFPGTKTFWSDWGDLNTEASDYLRSHHFALPVNGRPLVEGVDFIAK